MGIIANREITNTEKQLIEYIGRSGCFTDIFDKVDIEYSPEAKQRIYKIEADRLKDTLSGLNEKQRLLSDKIAIIKEQMDRLANDDIESGEPPYQEGMAALNRQWQELLGQKEYLSDHIQQVERALASKGDYEIPTTLLGEFISSPKPKVILYYNNVSGGNPTERWISLCGTFVHEMYHAWNYFQSSGANSSMMAVDEPMVEFASLVFLRDLCKSAEQSKHQFSEEVSKIFENRRMEVKNKRRGFGTLPAYAFGYYLYENAGTLEAHLIEEYALKSASISSTQPEAKEIETSLIPSYPFTEEERIKDLFIKLILGISISEHSSSVMFHNYLKIFIENSKRIISSSLPYSGDNVELLTKGLPEEYNGLKVSVGFGKGVWADVTWIGFLADGQKIQKGIYPVYLYYRFIDTLILAYGVSATYNPGQEWPESCKKLSIKDHLKKIKYHRPKKYKESFVYKIYENPDIDKMPATYDSDLLDILTYYKWIMSYTPKSSPTLYTPLTPNPTPSTFDISKVVNTIKSSGLIYSDLLIKRFTISLMTKPFVILSGLAGSGKTQLAISFAKAMCKDIDSQMKVIPVGADWTNRDPLLGYPNALDRTTYVSPESGVLELIKEASKPDNAQKPYFFILDEMNMSYVERYFADFLSVMESGEAIKLWEGSENNDTPTEIKLPQNLYIIGTINVDETTYQFSPKVLDRANVIEFKIDDQEMTQYLDNAPIVNIKSIEGVLAENIASEFVALSSKKSKFDFSANKNILVSIFSELKKVNAEFGYRSAYEIGRFINLATTIGGLSDQEATDAAIVQKLLPKLHGSRKKLSPILKTLWKLCGEAVELEVDSTVSQQTKFTLSADKILRMYRSAVDNGFTSFSEA